MYIVGSKIGSLYVFEEMTFSNTCSCLALLDDDMHLAATYYITFLWLLCYHGVLVSCFVYDLYMFINMNV